MATALDNLARKQIYIPATQPETVQLRVAAYCRVSTDSDDQLNSFAAQNTHYNQMIRNHDLWELVDIYADAGITGTSAAKRGDFQRMLADCRKGKIDKILVKSISRFARNSMECLETIRELKSLGISVFFEEHNIDTKMVSSEMLTAVIAACAQAESESISKNMRWSYQKRMTDGTYIPSSLPYGYTLTNGQICIIECEARIIQEIFQQYLAGNSKLSIAKELNERGIRTRTGHLWDYCAIRYILRNVSYTGNSLWQKTYKTDTIPTKKLRNDGERCKYYAECTHPAIIDSVTFQLVEELLNKRKDFFQGSNAPENPIRERLICGNCGSKMRTKHSAGTAYWCCRKRANNASECSVGSVPVVQIYDAFERFYYNLKNYPGVLDSLLKNMISVHNRQMLWSPAIMELNKEISDILSQSHALSLLKKQGAVDSDVFISMSNQLAKQLRSAKQRKEQIQKQDDDETITQTQNMIETLDAGPEFLDSFDEELFCELIDKIIVDSNTKIRFRLKNGLELPESIERTVR